MTGQSTTAATVDRSLRLARWPADVMIALLPGTRTGPAPVARVIVDRVDATVRAALATALGDQSLRSDAAQRAAAADERERALNLRREAERRTEQAEAQLDERHKEAARRRQRASGKATERRRAASESKQRRTINAAKAANERTKVSRAQEAAADDRIEQQQAAARLPAVEEQAAALQERALAAEEHDESQRLGEAAARIKEERKQDRAP